MINDIKLFYIKNRIRSLCYPHSFYLVYFELKNGDYYFKIDTKDKMLYKKSIEGKFPEKSIIRNLPVYLDHIKNLILAKNVEPTTLEQFNHLFNLLKQNYNGSYVEE